jgi:HSP20 family molecular chaperone IbpA
VGASYAKGVLDISMPAEVNAKERKIPIGKG